MQSLDLEISRDSQIAEAGETLLSSRLLALQPGDGRKLRRLAKAPIIYYFFLPRTCMPITSITL